LRCGRLAQVIASGRDDLRVLVEQTTAVHPQCLGDFAGRLDPDELTEINVALRARI
jgi:mRNA-degrading endonuclease toxin of MazEF toxin-antitoxin module